MKLEIDSNFIELLPINLRQFRLYTDSQDVILLYDNNAYITTIIINDKFRLKIGDELELEGIKYKVNLVRRNGEFFHIFQEKVTKTSQFIMPLLEGTYEYYDFKNTFYNSYISKDYKHIYLVYKFKPTEEYLEIESRLNKHSLFVEMKDPDTETVVFKFRLPEQFSGDIKKIMKGKYSDISPTLKSKICIFHKFGTQTKTFRMLHRDVKLREEMSKDFGFEIPEDIELMTRPYLEEEIWSEISINKFEEMINHD